MICKKCGLEKEIEQFWFNKRTQKYIKSCKECIRKQQNKLYALQHPKVILGILKFCTRCNQEKDESKFNAKDKRFNHLSWCKECFSVYDKEYKVGKFEYYDDWKCKCGLCDNRLKIQPHHRKFGIPKFYPSHNTRGENNPMYGIRLCDNANGFFGKHHTEKARTINSEWHIKNCKGENNGMYGVHRYGKEAPHWGFTHTEETKKIMSEKKQGDKSHAWLGGVSFEPYSPEFNKNKKENIRTRDNFICQRCGKSNKNIKRKFPVHHIDYDKKNNNNENLITLCNSCHAKTNWNRKYWKEYFLNIIRGM